METGNRHQFALVEADQRCIDHVFHRHDDRRGQFLPRQARNFPHVSRRRSGQDRLDADPLVSKFVLQRMSEREDIGFGGAVHTVECFRRDANDGADVDDRARATVDECRCRGVSQSRESDAVECDHLFHFLDVGIEKRHDGADTSVVTSVVILESSFSFASTFARSTLSLRSATIGGMWRPVALSRFVASALRGASLRATRIRSYPRFARRSAYTAPMPLEAPVTRAVPFDVELLISFFSCLQSSLFTFHMDYSYNPFSDFDSYSRALVTDFFWGLHAPFQG